MPGSSDPFWTIGPEQFGAEWPEGGAPLRCRAAQGAWPLFHPSPLDAGSGYREHRAEVVFTVPGAPPEAAELRLRFAGSHGPCPDIQLELDGKHRAVFPAPYVETRRNGDPSFAAGIEAFC